MWKNSLPFEDVVEIGWLFCSTPGMSAEQIQKELFAHTGIHASLRWKLISIGVKGKLTADLESRALHISVRGEDCNLAKAKFTKLVFARHRHRRAFHWREPNAADSPSQGRVSTQ
jgi:hypothetical protein